jgi:hypothetical protein
MSIGLAQVFPVVAFAIRAAMLMAWPGIYHLAGDLRLLAFADAQSGTLPPRVEVPEWSGVLAKRSAMASGSGGRGLHFSEFTS